MKPPRLYKRKLTGNVRYRARGFSDMLILQVEEEVYSMFPQPWEPEKSSAYCTWRDATVIDMQQISIKGKLNE